MSSPPQTRRLAAVLFADIVGYTRLTSQDESAALELVEVLHSTARSCTASCGGKVIKFIGDAAMAEFSSTESAVRCAISIEKEFTSRAAESGHPALLRVGVHVGDVTASPDGDIHGEGVNIAARIQREAQPGEVLVSEDVWRQLRSRADLRFVAAGERELKGIPLRVGVFSAGAALTAAQLLAAPPPEAPAPPSAVERGRVWVGAHRRFAVWLAAALVLGVLAGTYLTRGDALQEIRAATPAAPAEVGHSIAVLPFGNLSGDPANAYFSDGITEDILTQIAQIDDLKVVSRTSAMQYRGSDRSLRQIAEELRVAYVLEGTVRREGNRVRITAQLIDARTDAHLWAQTYDRENAGVLEVQSTIAEEIAGALRLRLSGGRASRAPRASVGGYSLLLRARERLRQPEADSTRVSSAIALLRQAVDGDPGYALAHAALAEGYARLGSQAAVDSAEWFARRALSLDSTLVDAHLAMARVQIQREAYPAAEASVRRALALSPEHEGAAELLKWMAPLNLRRKGL
jgi:adenylate cyclase